MGPAPHSDALRRPRRNTVKRSEVSRSTFMQRRTRRHHDRTQMHTNTHAHMCKQMSTLESKHAHRDTHTRSQRLLRGLNEREAGSPARRGPSSLTEAVLGNSNRVSSLVVHVSSVSVLLEWLQISSCTLRGGSG